MVLVAEDEAAVRGMIVRILEREGIVVLPAEDGQVAEQIFLERGKEIRLVLSDVTMPRRNGIWLVYRLRELNPDIPILMVTTENFHDELPPLLELPKVELVAKPFRPEALAKKVREILWPDGQSQPNDFSTSQQ